MINSQSCGCIGTFDSSIFFLAILKPNTNAQKMFYLSYLLRSSVEIFERDCYSFLCGLQQGVSVPSLVVVTCFGSDYMLMTEKLHKSRNTWNVNGRGCGCIGTVDLGPKCAQFWKQVQVLNFFLFSCALRLRMYTFLQLFA